MPGRLPREGFQSKTFWGESENSSFHIIRYELVLERVQPKDRKLRSGSGTEIAKKQPSIKRSRGMSSLRKTMQKEERILPKEESKSLFLGKEQKCYEDRLKQG